MKSTFLALILFASVNAVWSGPETFNTGMPFGKIGERDLDHLEKYAKKEGVNLMDDINAAYKKDEVALARVFAFSLKFTALDKNAKAYGQIIYSSFLNLAEAYGIDRYSKLVAAQPAAVKQRIRDFIFYDVTQAPAKIRKEVEASSRASAPLLFPPDYVFAVDDPIFSERQPTGHK